MPVKQFIEEGVMFECQEKYNGDFPRYMAERTRNNLGVISIENGDEKYEINPVEITEFINPALLEKKVKLPNGGYKKMFGYDYQLKEMESNFHK